ncbi:chromosome replication initiation inhibitor protein [Bifidobacterium mongoliense]|uniref:Chromosome replication initiation inhibitor protein n=2 Tax=Bifidobacterium mongoliense TaxID=518643 RepID=A0A423UF27_9BIFI|nr:chromosome replication initiation inhibitor protein [Bifidobacterium mongoliense]
MHTMRNVSMDERTSGRGSSVSMASLARAIRAVPLEQLVALQQIVETGSFDGAADELRVSQSAVSQRIKALENQVGNIVVRRTKPVQATETGQLLLRLAKQITLAQEEAIHLIAAKGQQGVVNIRIVVNADSLESWVLPALAPVAQGHIALDIRRQDEHVSTRLLRTGEVMAAITADERPVRGCSITRLGAMAYHAVCTPEFRRRWFARGLTREALESAPLVQFDRDDRLQYRFVRRITKAKIHPPTHYVPTSIGYNDAIALGFGWGLMPDSYARGYPEGRLVRISPEQVLVPLYWQQWRLSSPSLDEVATAIISASGKALVAA